MGKRQIDTTTGVGVMVVVVVIMVVVVGRVVVVDRWWCIFAVFRGSTSQAPLSIGGSSATSAKPLDPILLTKISCGALATPVGGGGGGGGGGDYGGGRGRGGRRGGGIETCSTRYFKHLVEPTKNTTTTTTTTTHRCRPGPA